MSISHGLRFAALLALTASTACGGIVKPRYCGPMLQDNIARMNSMSDRDVQWVATGISRSMYRGPCLCPDDTDSLGQQCGARSAHSRSGIGYCTADDVPPSYLPAIRREAAERALPVECGGMGQVSILSFDK